jgi:hypothetical protein
MCFLSEVSLLMKPPGREIKGSLSIRLLASQLGLEGEPFSVRFMISV